MSDHAKKEVELFGKKRTFHADTGVVLNANQRSDTYVSGSGKSSSVAGYGGGNTSISSEVVVTSDIWIREASGKELRLRFKCDIPVREGNIVHAVYVTDTNSDKALDGLYVMFYNGTTREWFRPRKELGKALLKDAAPQTYFWRTFLTIMAPCTALGVALVLLSIHKVSGRIDETTYSLDGLIWIIIGFIVGGAVALMRTIISVSGMAKPYDTLDQVFKSFIPDLEKATKEFSVPDAQPEAAANFQPQLAIPQEDSKVFCTNCGKPPVVGSTFCGSCGAKLAQPV